MDYPCGMFGECIVSAVLVLTQTHTQTHAEEDEVYERLLPRLKNVGLNPVYFVYIHPVYYKISQKVVMNAHDVLGDRPIEKH